ncbi:uracil-DNA glycosylase family protein [Kitasatospora sp. Root107]|uniref:uracil-DNA glycosylase family protein n=1 Tax=Kitasatospora sp. Root107 TaxID=1736424 RepID=UPI0007091F3C|nr:uracil-DNA glycosylase family protein [Kitasatospora sp. Root107]KQV15968.1 uracil-DNA glycosylase [Kitasatospora sp. Root107]
MHEFDPGVFREPYLSLVRDFPGQDVYPTDDFRTEWGPVFHRGRLDGTARVLVIGQDPAQHEAIVRRILVGTAGRRVQGFLARLGIDRSYVMVNTFLYSVFGQQGGQAHAEDPDIAGYRNSWLDALVTDNEVEAVIALGSLAGTAFRMWREATPVGAAFAGTFHRIIHPTFPESSGDHAAAMARLTASWNEGLEALHPAIAHPDQARQLVPYGPELTAGDLVPVPAADFPLGLPDWMRSEQPWAVRTGATAAEKRATVVVTIPPDLRPF